MHSLEILCWKTILTTKLFAMKSILNYIPVAALIALSFISCKYDSYLPPDVEFSGQLLYAGRPFLFDGRPDGDLSKIVQFTQYGYGKSGNPITAQVKGDGSFKQLLFPGMYHITMRSTPYPFVLEDWPRNAGNLYDTIHMEVKNNYVMNVNVVPYFEVTDVSSKVSGTDLLVSFTIKKIRDGADLVNARIYANTAELVNSGVRMSTVKSLDGIDISKPVEVKLSLIDYRNKFINNFRDYLFFRVALETNISNAYFLWSDTQEATGLPLKFNDVSNQYLKNYQQPFSLGAPQSNDPGRRFLVNDWSYTQGMQFSMYDAWGDRRFMSAENWGGPALNGAVWQTTTLPAGKYVLIATRGWNSGDLNGVANRAIVSIASGSTLGWNASNILFKADCYAIDNRTAVTIPFELNASTQVSIGYAVNFLAGELNALSFTSWKLIKSE